MADMTDDELEFERQLARDRRALRARKASVATAERSAAMGGEFPSEGEVILAEQKALEAAEEAKLKRQAARPPGILPDTRDEVADVQRRIEEGRAIASPGGEPEGGYLEERESTSIPFLRPTRIEEVSRPAPMVDTPSMRGIRIPAPPLTEFVEGGETVLRPPTETEEFIESFARQPVLTREAGRQLAAGAPAERVQKRVGEMEGAVIETPFQAVFRAAPASVEAMATEAYRKLPILGEEPISASSRGNLYTRYLRTLSDVVATAEQAPIRALAPVPGMIAGGIEAAAEARQRLAAPVQEAALGAVRGGVSALERAAGVKPGSSPLAQELATLGGLTAALGGLTAAIPAPAAIPDKPISQRIREGETLADVIRQDPKTVMVYDREFGALAPIAIEATGIGLSLPLPFSPIGVGVDVARATGIPGKAVKAVESKVNRVAMSRAEAILANKVYSDITGGPSPEPMKTLRQVEEAVQAMYENPDLRIGVELPSPDKFFVDMVNARKDLAKITPRTDLVRVSPSYAVPVNIARRVVAEAAADVKALKEERIADSIAANREVFELQSLSRKRPLTTAEQEALDRARFRSQVKPVTRIEESAARDAAVVRAAQGEYKRLDELGQFQVLLDGLSTPRVWDNQFARAVRGLISPEEAMKRASVTAAEQEVARKGQQAIRAFRAEVEAGTKAGESLDTIIERVAKRELSSMNRDEILRKVLEEAYGGQTAATIFERAKSIPMFRGSLLTPSRGRELHQELIKNKIIDPSVVSPNFAANAIKIIMEEGVRKRVSKEALEAYAKQYPDSPRPTLAIQGKVGPLEADAIQAERKFFENGAEELFRLADTIPTRAQGIGAAGITESLERVSAAVRNARQKVRIPGAALVELVGGEVAAAPIRAYLTTRTGLPVQAITTGVSTPYGYLRPDDITRMIDDLGGFGPSRMDVQRRGLMVQDILLSAVKGFDLERAADMAPPGGYSQLRYAWGTAKEAGRAVINYASSRPYGYALVDSIEDTFRRGAFIKALQQGESPEAAMTIARRSQLDYGAQDSAVIQALAPYWAGAVNTMAAGTEFVDRVAKNPRNYSIYLRALREQQRLQDPSGEMGDLPVRRFMAPVSDELSKGMFGRPVDVVGPNAPLLQPVDAAIGTMQTVAAIGSVTDLLMDEGIRGLVAASLDGSREAMEDLADRMATISAGLRGGDQQIQSKSRAMGPAAIDQTYMATIALARALDPDRTTGLFDTVAGFLMPDFEKPPKELALDPKGDPLRWATRPPDKPGSYVFTDSSSGGIPDPSGQRIDTYFVIKPTKEGRQNLRTIASTPIIGTIGQRALTAAGTGLEEGTGEGILWALGAETVEEPTARAVEQVRPTSP